MIAFLTCVEALAAAKCDPSVLQDLWPAIASCGVTRSAASLFGTAPVPEGLLGRVLASSSLASALAAAHLNIEKPDVPTLAALVVTNSIIEALKVIRLRVRSLFLLDSR